MFNAHIRHSLWVYKDFLDIKSTNHEKYMVNLISPEFKSSVSLKDTIKKNQKASYKLGEKYSQAYTWWKTCI